MKKLLYTLLAVSIIFSSCKKEDEEPTNSDEVILTMDSILGTWEIISNEVIFSSETSHIVTDPIYGTQTVTVTNSLGITPSEAFHHAMLEAYDVANYLTSLFDVELLEGYANGKPEIAIPSPIASSLLQTSGASQIRTDKAIMNRSKGRGADWEVYDLQQAQKIVDMPDNLERIEQKLDQILSSTTDFHIFNDLAGNLSRVYMETHDGL